MKWWLKSSAVTHWADAEVSLSPIPLTAATNHLWLKHTSIQRMSTSHEILIKISISYKSFPTPPDQRAHGPLWSSKLQPALLSDQFTPAALIRHPSVQIWSLPVSRRPRWWWLNVQCVRLDNSMSQTNVSRWLLWKHHNGGLCVSSAFYVSQHNHAQLAGLFVPWTVRQQSVLNWCVGVSCGFWSWHWML